MPMRTAADKASDSPRRRTRTSTVKDASTLSSPSAAAVSSTALDASGLSSNGSTKKGKAKSTGASDAASASSKVKAQSKARKQNEGAVVEASTAGPSAPSSSSSSAREMPWQSLADPAVYSSEPPLFTPDGAYYFVPTSQSIRIISRHTGATISTLHSPTVFPDQGLAQEGAQQHQHRSSYRHRITAIALHPSNPLQLLSTSTDGTLTIWDYLDARVLRILYLPQAHASAQDAEAQLAGAGMPITHLATSSNCPDWVFVAARRLKAGSGSGIHGSYSTILLALRLSVTATGEATEPVLHVPHVGPGSSSTKVPVYIPTTQTRLGKLKLVPSAMKLCPRAEHLIVAGGRKLHIASLRRSRVDDGSSKPGMDQDGVGAATGTDIENISCPDGLARFTTSDALTTLAVHPTERSIATGDVTGKIRIFHGILEEEFLARRRGDPAAEDGDEDEAGQSSNGKKDGKPKAEKDEKSELFFNAPSTILHWHAHAVSTLAYIPLAATGARLLSGGEEATLVLWNIQAGGGGAGRALKEFVPRLGAPLASVCLAGPTSNGGDGSGDKDEEIVCALRDGSLVFLNPANLRILRTFARFKVDAGRSLFPAWRQRSMPAPLAIQPILDASGRGARQNLVLTSGHPSTIQFYDPIADALVAELEVVPSNRVSRPDDVPIEPARVELVAFAPLPPSSSSEDAPSRSIVSPWMATLDARRPFGATRDAAPRFTSEISLKFWAWDAEAERYVLCTSIDRPHGDEGIVTDLSFGWIGPSTSSSRSAQRSNTLASQAPTASSNPFENLVCISTGSDGKIKTWRPLPLSRTDALGAASKKVPKTKKGQPTGVKAAHGLSTQDPTAYHWVARSIFSFRCTLPGMLAWAPDPPTALIKSSISQAVLGATSTSGLVAVAQGAFVTLWELKPRSNSLLIALCAPQLVSTPTPTSNTASYVKANEPLIEGARTCAFVGRGSRYVVGASATTVVCWDLLSAQIMWTKSYHAKSKRKEDSAEATPRGHSPVSIARIVPIAPSSNADGADEVFGVLLNDSVSQSSRLELYDLGEIVRKPRSRPHANIEWPFLIRSLALTSGIDSTSTTDDSTTQANSEGARKAEAIARRKLDAAIQAIAAYALTADFEPVQLGQPAAVALAVAQFGPEHEDDNVGHVLPRAGVEDVVRARRPRTILDDLLGGGQAFLPPDDLSLDAAKRGPSTARSKGPGAASGTLHDVFRLFDGPAHQLPSMPALFDSFAAAILPRKAGETAVKAPRGAVSGHDAGSKAVEDEEEE